MSAARKSSSTEREADAPKPGQRKSGWRQSRCSLDSHYVTNRTLTVREGVITQIRAKSPGAPQTSTLSLYLIEQFNVMLGTVPRHSIRYHLLSTAASQPPEEVCEGQAKATGQKEMGASRTFVVLVIHAGTTAGDDGQQREARAATQTTRSGHGGTTDERGDQGHRTDPQATRRKHPM